MSTDQDDHEGSSSGEAETAAAVIVSASAHRDGTHPAESDEPLIGNPRDVLCGRGLHIVNHHGNLQLHLLVNKYRWSYRHSRRQEKSKIIRAIMRETKKSGARFLQRIAAGNGNNEDRWVEVDDKKAYEKVSHALRLQRVNESTNMDTSAVEKLGSRYAEHEATTQQAPQSHQPSSLAGSSSQGFSIAAASLGTLLHRNEQPHLQSGTNLTGMARESLNALSSFPGSVPSSVRELLLYNQLQNRQRMMRSTLSSANHYDGSFALPVGQTPNVLSSSSQFTSSQPQQQSDFAGMLSGLAASSSQGFPIAAASSNTFFHRTEQPHLQSGTNLTGMTRESLNTLSSFPGLVPSSVRELLLYNQLQERQRMMLSTLPSANHYDGSSALPIGQTPNVLSFLSQLASSEQQQQQQQQQSGLESVLHHETIHSRQMAPSRPNTAAEGDEAKLRDNLRNQHDR